MKKRKILPTIVTTDKKHFLKLKEVEKLGLEEVCFFPTNLKKEERKKFYLKLEKSSLRKIPFVHLRSDMELWELEYFIDTFGTEIFNTHSGFDFPISKEWLKYNEIIYIENTISFWDKEELKNFGGICIDFSHLEDARLIRKDIYNKNIKIIEEFPCSCAHISAIKKKAKYSPEFKINYYNDHYFNQLSEFDYLKNYPKKYFSKIIALELENSIEEQLKAKQYIEKLLNF